MNRDADVPLVRVFVALGANLADPQQQVWRAIQHLETLSAVPLRRSSLWQTTPVDCPPGSPAFINAVVELALPQTESAENLLRRLQRLEKEFGRQPKTLLNEPRPMDLDIVAFGNQTRNTAELILPHPRAHCRRFVLAPLAELAPEFILPGQSRSVQELLQDLPDDPQMRKL
jgi:2-amino-4-hydroxy-6-hydroxymethyldihydropteridine diphosphokinase